MKRQDTNQDASTIGAWLPWPLVEAILKFDLRPASRWRVFLAILCTWCRYGRKEAWLTVPQIAEQTDLSERTVKAALKDLYELGIVARIGRGKLAVDVTGYGAGREQPSRSGQLYGTHNLGASMVARPEGSQALTLANSSISPLKVKKPKSGFSRRQWAAIQSTLGEVSSVLGLEANLLILSPDVCEAIGLRLNSTIGEALTQHQDSCDSRAAHKLTGAILALRSDESIGGQELIL